MPMDESFWKLMKELPGSPEAKERLQAVLEELVGELEIEEACKRLQIDQAEFMELKRTVVERMLQSAENA
jgi:hypothetical protein